MTRVVWLGDRRLCMDQHLVDTLLSDPADDYRHEGLLRDEAPMGPGAVVVVPARYHTPAEITERIAGLGWCVLVLTSDEESTFDHTAVEHPNMRTWVMTPRPGQHEPGPRYLGEGCHIDTSNVLATVDPDQRTTDVVFVGQVTHEHRHAMVRGLMATVAAQPDTTVDLVATDGFMQGEERHEYLRRLARARVALAPSGPATPDSFRLHEALEAGCVPIVEDTCPAFGDRGYWSLVYPDGVPFPVVHDWHDELAKTVEHVLANWRPLATRCQAWWLQQKRRLRHQLAADVAALSGEDSRGSEITVLVPTSPTSRSWRDAWTDTLEVIDSVRVRLPDADVIVMADGVRPEQEHLRERYDDYLAALVWSCAHELDNVTPLVFDHHGHQANTTRVALEHVHTPLVLFVEHDTPLVDHVPFDDLAAVVRSGFANLVRLHHETRVLDEHQHLMLDRTPRTLGHMAVDEPVPLLRTVQWSQRPHLAATGFYRSLIGTYFGTESRTMIEDVMHGVVQDAWNRHGVAGWEQFRLVMYAPPGSIQRSTHLDGRGDDPKFPMLYAYDGPTPEGAPQP